MVYNIPVYGLLGSPDNPEDKAKYFHFTDLLMHLNNAKNYDILNLDIASDGGYCDVVDKMIVALKDSGKLITSCNSGNVCSAASKLFTLPPKEYRSFYPNRGIFLIHNPWVSDASGDASDLNLIAKELQSTETNFAKWYSDHTGSEIEIIKGFMKENIPLTVEQVESLGFANIVKEEVKAMAILKSNINNKNMDMDNNKDEVVEKLNGMEKLFNKILSKFKIKSIMLSDTNGIELEFPEVTDISELAIGVKVLQNGAPATGEFTMPDGVILKSENGQVTEIVQPSSDEASALKQENEQLKGEIARLQESNKNLEAKNISVSNDVNALRSEFSNFKALFTSYNPPSNVENIPEENKNRKPFKTKE